MSNTKNKVYVGDAQDELKRFDTNSIDAIVTDPPYGISFIGLEWDRDVPACSIWKEALRVLKPGGYLLAFAGSRTYHRMATNIEKAGFEIRDQIMWIYSSGFPRSHNIERAIKKKHGATAAKKWRGWGTTLKPAHEPIVVARKPIVGTVAENVLTFGTGGLNIDKSRASSIGLKKRPSKKVGTVIPLNQPQKGRFPANVILTDIEQSWTPYYYCAKPTTKERDEGLGKFALKTRQQRNRPSGENTLPHRGVTGSAINSHPTVKPLALMEYLITLVTPEGGIVLDPFAGSGSTLVAAKNLKHPYIGIDQDAQYVEIARARLSHLSAETVPSAA